MSHSTGRGVISGHPIAIVFVTVVFLVFIYWMASAAAPGGASHYHTQPCDSSQMSGVYPFCPGNDSNTAFWDLNGGTTDNFANFYNEFTLIFGGILVVVALMGGLALWMLRGRSHESSF